MFIKIYTYFVLSTLMLRTLIVCSSSSWLISWFGLEINLIAFIPLILSYPSASSSEASIRYFLSQAIASIIIIIALIIIFKSNSINRFPPSNILISVALGVKIGMAPTHFWFPQVIELISWPQGAILLTWQKIAPIILLLSTNLSISLLFLIILSCVVGAVGGFNINSIKKIITFSSISHLAWIGSTTFLSFKIWWVYFSVYSTISLSLIFLFWHLNVNFTNSLYMSISNKLTKIFLLFNVLSIGGIPPLLGVLPKIIVISYLSTSSSQEILISVILIATSVITLFFYIKILYYSIIANSHPPLGNSTQSVALNSSSALLFTLSIFGNVSLVPLVLLI